MDLTPYTTTLSSGLVNAAAAGDEQVQRTAAVLAAVLEPAARLAIMNALSDLAAEVTAELGNRVVEVRLDGRDVRVAVSGPTDTDDRFADRDFGAERDFGTDRDFGADRGHRGERDRGGEPPRDAGRRDADQGDDQADAGRGRAGWGDGGRGRGPFAGVDGGDISRMTLRLIDEVKSKAEQAAASQGVSLNTWVSQAVQSSLHGGAWGGRGGRGRRQDDRDTERGAGDDQGDRRGGRSEGHRIRGWVQG
jgi:hypothetical protein